ncbi:hypothetical protein NBRC116188_07580 [Oceaniserpentilla sp. 4NH20-0058]|uniref:DUF3135 domain-containing protein n=1 Tax=Oceaniserpentilla sp. 4NH20-0058 TaxID=3127660 RepID=UPI00310A9092
MKKPLPSFERMAEMAKNDPDALERLRLEMVRDAIQSAPEEYRQRLHGLQFQIDGKRLLSKNPMQACIEISRMMNESLLELKTYINGIDGDTDTPLPSIAEPAKVLKFPTEVL